jgi:hypothetical protein
MYASEAPTARLASSSRRIPSLRKFIVLLGKAALSPELVRSA